MLAKPQAEHRVDGIFQHEDVVCHTQRQCAAGRALAGDDSDDGNRQTAHLHQVSGDSLALSPLFGLLAGYAPGVSMKVMMGRPNFSACFMRRRALR